MEPQVKVLDQGYVQVIETWGSEEGIIEAARMSTDKGFLGWSPEHAVRCDKCFYTAVFREPISGACPNFHDCGGYMQEDKEKSHAGDAKLLKFLYNHKHYTPFEMAGMIFEVKAPIFVFREWHRHRTQSYNELSARYVPIPDENYIPSRERIIDGAKLAASNRQAQGLATLDEDRLTEWLTQLEEVYALAEQVYDQGLKWGIPKEIARLPVPVARFSKMRVSANVRNWLAFLSLRMDKNAQWEIRQYANTVAALFSLKFPRTFNLFKDAQA